MTPRVPVRCDTPRSTGPRSPLCTARLAAGLSLREFARAIPVSVATASRWETGRRRPHSADCAQIVITLGLDAGTVRSWFAGQQLLSTEALRGHNLRRLRTERNLSRRALADAVGVSVATVAHWECGRRALPVARVPDLADALHLAPGQLVSICFAPIDPVRETGALAVLRRRVGMTQVDVAERVGVSTGTVSAWERGVRTPAWPRLRALQRVYCCSVTDIAQAAGVHVPPQPNDSAQPPLATAITSARCWRGASLRTTAARISVNWQTLRRWERGETTPGIREVRSLEGVLGVSPGSLTRLVDPLPAARARIPA